MFGIVVMLRREKDRLKTAGTEFQDHHTPYDQNLRNAERDFIPTVENFVFHFAQKLLKKLLWCECVVSITSLTEPVLVINSSFLTFLKVML